MSHLHEYIAHGVERMAAAFLPAAHRMEHHAKYLTVPQTSPRLVAQGWRAIIRSSYWHGNLAAAWNAYVEYYIKCKQAIIFQNY